MADQRFPTRSVPGLVCSSVVVLLVFGPHTCAQAQGLATWAQRRQLPPQDETAKAPGFAPFLARFKEAIRRRDAASLLSLVHEGIVQDPFGDPVRGREAFRKHRALDDRTSEFWVIVEGLLEKGAAVDGCNDPSDRCRVSYPYWFERYDGPGDLIVDGENVPMREKPSDRAEVVMRLSYDVVREATAQGNPPPDGWTAVRLLGWGGGFIRSERLYNLSRGYRMMFLRLDTGTWVLSSFLAGD
jgi:hypothetical protein